jgi:hypothetical protein
VTDVVGKFDVRNRRWNVPPKKNRPLKLGTVNMLLMGPGRSRICPGVTVSKRKGFFA